MRYEEKFEKYLNGELNEDESREVQGDVEKLQVLLAHLDEELDEELFEDEKADEGEKKAQDLSREVSKAVSRKLRRYTVVAGAVVLAVVMLIIFGLSPLLDRICYNPSKSQTIKTTNDGLEAEIIYSPFNTVMTVYMELFCGARGFSTACVRPEGYGRYSMDIQTQINGEISHHPLELVRNHLYRQDLSWNYADMPDNAFTYRYSYADGYCGIDKEEAQKKLENVPEAVKIRAAVSFKDTKNITEVKEFMEQYETYYLYFPMVVGQGYSRYWGYSPKYSGMGLEGTYDEEKYPYLDLYQYDGDDRPEEVYEQHVESMLKYMLANEEFLRIFDSDVPGENVVDLTKYTYALRYIQDHGVNCYGTVVYASKQELLDMMNDSSVDGVYMMDGSLDL